MERLLCRRWEPVYTAVQRPKRANGVYNLVPFTSMLTSEPSKINQKQTGASHLLISCSLGATCCIRKRHLRDWQARRWWWWIWQTSQRQFTALHTVFLLFFSVSGNLYIFTHYDTIWSPLRMLICTSINSYLKDKSKHVCFLFVFFPLLNSPKAFMSTLVIRTREGFSWRRGAEDALMYS